MIRITETSTSQRQVELKVEGRIASDAVHLLEHECRSILDGGRRVQLDLSEAVYIDASAVRLLNGFRPGEVRIVNCCSWIALLLRDGRDR